MIAGRLSFRGALRIAVLSGILSLAARTGSAAAASYYWNNPTGATWFNTTGATADWNYQTSTGPLVDWSDDSPTFDSTAIFNGTGETVTLGATVDPNVIDFNSTGYTIAPASSYTVNMSGTAPTINVGSGSATFAATITAPLTSTGPLTIADTGTGNTTFTFSGTTTITGGSLTIDGNTNSKDTFTLDAPNLSLNTLTFTATVGSTTNFAPKSSSNTITFTGTNPTINTGESGNSSYKDISYITEKVVGPTSGPLTFMNNDGLGTQSALSFTNANDSFVGGIAVQSAASASFNSSSLTATGTTRLNFNVAGANGTGSGAGPIYVYANGTIITDQGSQAAFTENMTNNIYLNYGNMTPSQGIFETAIGGTKASSGNTIFNYSGTISGNGAVLIGNDVGQGSGGAGVTIFSGPQKTYTGETIMNGSVTAIFQMGATNVLPSGTTLMFGNAAPGQDLTNSIGALDLNGYSQSIASLQSNVDPASTINGITNTSGTIATLTITGSTVDTFIGSLGVTSQTLLLGTSNNNEALTRSGSGTTILGSALNGTSSTYVGNTLVNGTSTLQAGSFTAFSPNSNYTVESILDLAGYNNTINSLASTTTNGVVTSSQPNVNLNGLPTVLTIGSNSTMNTSTGATTFSGVLRDGGSTALLGLTKSGQLTQVLAGANTYSGPTMVSSGVLSITGSLSPQYASSASTVTVNGGTLNGSGSIAAPVTINATGTLSGTLTIAGTVGINTSATISPGSTGAAGALTVGGLTLYGGSNYDWKVTNAGGAAGTGYDTIAASGITVDFSASTTPINVDVSILDPNFNSSAVGQHWTLASSTGAITLPSGTANPSALFNAFTTSNVFGTFSVTQAAGAFTLSYTPVTLTTLTWQGGPGTWQPAGSAGDTAWNNGSSNGPFNSSSIAEFASGSGTVVLSNNISAAVLRFDTTGYMISGGTSNYTISATPSSGISSLDVQVTNATDLATIGAGIVSPLIKYGAGTLILSDGSGNTFGGSGGNGSLTVYAGTVRGGSSSLNANTISNTGTVVFDQTGISGATYAGSISGTGSVVILNNVPATPEVLTVSGNNTYIGGTTIGGGATMSVASNSNFGGPSTNLTLNGGTLLTTAANGITIGGQLTVTAAGGAITDQSAVSDNGLTGGGRLAVGAVLTKNGPGTLQILNNGLTGSGSIVIAAGALLVGNEADPNSNPSAFLGNNSLTLGNNTTLTIAAGTASTASITPPTLNFNGNATLALYKTGGVVGQGPLEPALNSTTNINPGSGSASATITITASGDYGNSLAGSSNVTLGNAVFSQTSGTITFQTVADYGANGVSTGLTFGAVTDNGDATVFLGQGNNLATTPILPGPGIQFNGTASGTTPTMTGTWAIGDPADTNGQAVVVAVQRVTNSQFAMTTGNITVNPGSQLSITPATGTYGPTTGTQTITLYGTGPVDNTDTPTGVLTLAGKSVATFNSSVDIVLASSTNPLLSGEVEINLSNGSSTQQTILTFDGPVTGSAGLDLQGGDLTQLTFAGANNLTGHTHLKGGQLIVDSGSSIGTGSLTLQQTTTHNPTLILNNAAQAIGNLSSAYGTQSSPTVPVTQTIQLNGTALTINETDFSGSADYGISPTDGTIAPGSSSIITGTGSVIYTGAPASSGNPAAYLSLSSTNTYSGGTTVTGGTLATTLGGTLGAGPVSLVAANNVASSLSLGAGQTVASLSNSSIGSGASTLAVANGSTLTVSGALGNTGTLTLGTITAPGATSVVGGGTVRVNGSPNLAAGSQIVVNAGTLQFDAPSGAAPAVISGSGATAPSLTVNSGATLQLAGAVSALSGGGNLANVYNNSSATGPGVGGLQVTGINQSVGIVSGTPSTSGPTTYTGDTVVGISATLTATQILQNTLTIGAGATVTLSPSTTGVGITIVGESNAAPSVSPSADLAAVGSSVTTGNISDPSDPIAAIQAAISAGSISGAAGALLENRIAAIEQLATRDPSLDASLLESRILATIPSASIWSSPAGTTIDDAGGGLLALDGGLVTSTSTSTLNAASVFSAANGLNGAATSVPEPSSLLLIGLGSLGLAAMCLKRRRSNRCLQGCRSVEPACAVAANWRKSR